MPGNDGTGAGATTSSGLVPPVTSQPQRGGGCCTGNGSLSHIAGVAAAAAHSGTSRSVVARVPEPNEESRVVIGQGQLMLKRDLYKLHRRRRRAPVDGAWEYF